MDAPIATLRWAAGTAIHSALRRIGVSLSPEIPTDGYDLEPVLDGALAWLARSQDIHGVGGSSAGWRLFRGWRPPYPETTGYLIPTLYDVAAARGDAAWAERALRMARWELTVQLEDGAWPGHHIGAAPVPVVFNTGQVIFGMLRAHAESGESAFLEAACRAADFLVRHQDSDGAWPTHTFAGMPHVYDVRVAWALLLLAKATGEERYSQTARRSLAWGVSKQNASGWFSQNQFRPGQLPNTHGIAYVTQSLVEAGMLAREAAWIDAGARAADRLLEKLETKGFIAGYHDERFGDAASFECVTGNIQAAITWLRLYQIRGDRRHLAGALRMIGRVRRMVPIDHANPGLRGGVPGSWPFHGRYAPFQFPNWATKFWVDALLLAMAIVRWDRGESLGGLSIVLADRYAG